MRVSWSNWEEFSDFLHLLHLFTFILKSLVTDQFLSGCRFDSLWVRRVSDFLQVCLMETLAPTCRSLTRRLFCHLQSGRRRRRSSSSACNGSIIEAELRSCGDLIYAGGLNLRDKGTQSVCKAGHLVEGKEMQQRHGENIQPQHLLLSFIEKCIKHKLSETFRFFRFSSN